ncbi:MAG TPA: alpha/beta fold hydrolase [Herpetosiphonaceae bacterium]|nr:alpha/beta fold hydrolase [Herpetosiphonaceae bacterium]
MPIVRTNLTFQSALGERRFIVILPDDYDDPPAQASRYPVVYLLHGIGGHEDEWLVGSRIAAYAAGRSLILVCADAGQHCYVDSADGSSLCETMAARDLVAFMDRSYRTIPHHEARGLMGLSMGGYGALYLSLRHPQTFGAAVSLSGALHIGQLPLGERRPELAHVDRLFPATCSGREQWDLFAQVRISPTIVREGMRWKLLCGVDDSLIEINRAFHHFLLYHAVPHTYDEYPGAHTWAFWDTHATESLDFLAAQLEPATSTPARI